VTLYRFLRAIAVAVALIATMVVVARIGLALDHPSPTAAGLESFLLDGDPIAGVTALLVGFVLLCSAYFAAVAVAVAALEAVGLARRADQLARGLPRRLRPLVAPAAIAVMSPLLVLRPASAAAPLPKVATLTLDDAQSTDDQTGTVDIGGSDETSSESTVPIDEVPTTVGATTTIPAPPVAAPTTDPESVTAPTATPTTTTPTTATPTTTTPSTTTTPTPTPTPAPPPTPTHVVQRGESFWTIARAELSANGHRPSDAEVSRYWRALIAANIAKVRNGDPNLIYPGQSFDLPKPQ
jgi:LysM repeat protein